MQPGYTLVTGASRGLGKFFARAVAARKQNLILVARSDEKLNAIASELRAAHGVLVEPIVFDLATRGAGQQLAQLLRARDLPVNLLVNNAGFAVRGEFWKISLERQLEMINLHNVSVVELIFNLLPSMIERRDAGIINVSSMAGFQPVPYATLYSATKAFLTTFSMALREELRGTGVIIVTVCPGRLRADPEEEDSQTQRERVPGRESLHEEVVRETLKKFDSGGGLVVPGRANRLMVMGQRLIPPNAVPKIVARASHPKDSPPKTSEG